MESIELNYNSLASLGYVSCNIPKDIMEITRKEINKMISTKFKNSRKYNYRFAGTIEHEYSLVKVVPILNQFFREIIPAYWQMQNETEKAKKIYQISKQVNNNIDDIWVNFQKKYEFNPLHNHGGEISFVYWTNIPYDIVEEGKLPIFSGTIIKNPVFTFVYNDINRNIMQYHINIDKSFEGKMIIFPSWLKHMVTPFYTSDEYRISVSGNLVAVNNG